MTDRTLFSISRPKVKEFYERYSKAVFGYLMMISGNKQLAEDLTGETFYRALLAIDSFRGESSAKTWLIRIARNLYLRWMEREKRKISLEDLNADGGIFASDQGDPEAQLIQKEKTERIFRALRSLPEKDRTLLHLSVQEGMAIQEIGEILDLSVPAVKVRLYRARRRLIRALEGDEAGKTSSVEPSGKSQGEEEEK
jgi:RNA polymerase sigma-70 factor (ECF subfamily)